MQVGQADVAAIRRALELAEQARTEGDVPIGAVVLGPDGVELGAGFNRREAAADPTGHAEIVALRAAGSRLGAWRLDGCTLAVTLEPCTMCAGALVLARVSRVVFGAWDAKAGAAGSVRDVLRDSRLNHQPEVIGGVLERECGEVLRTFFDGRR
jgi:tRNA(adenine34) deaminase